MRFLFRKRTLVIVFVLTVLVIGIFAFFVLLKTSVPITETSNNSPKYQSIGESVEGRPIDAYTYGNGNTRLLFVGGIHGGYEWNSVLLSYQFMDYLKENQDVIPDNITVTIIPSANPDGVYKVIGKEDRFTIADTPKVADTTGIGRFNAHDVDLNRNFDCKWKPTSMWRSKTVSAGTEAFSEPEAEAIRDFVLENSPTAVIFWHSQSNAVYASECENGILPQTLDIMNAYSRASGYPAVKSFDSYAISGDAEGWLASKNIPAITVELRTHEIVEWEKNSAGIKALFKYYGEKTEKSL